MSPQQFFAFNHPFVVSESIDGEAVIMNLKSGHYYSARETGALVWDWLGEGHSPTAIATALARIYGGATDGYVAALNRFVLHLLEQGLIAPVESGAAADGAPAPPVSPPAQYRPPLLEVYADMQDLLLLDPIHDTDEVGWPVAKPTRPS